MKMQRDQQRDHPGDQPPCTASYTSSVHAYQ